MLLLHQFDVAVMCLMISFHTSFIVQLVVLTDFVSYTM
jgi:hypothetical protein